ncbi:MAG: hypothetical protein U0930_25790 [Pirellulales bacterium]
MQPAASVLIDEAVTHMVHHVVVARTTNAVVVTHARAIVVGAVAADVSPILARGHLPNCWVTIPETLLLAVQAAAEVCMLMNGSTNDHRLITVAAMNARPVGISLYDHC